MRRFVPLTVAVIALLAWSGPFATRAAAYTIFFKNGSQLVAKDKYRVQGDKAIITLPSGTEAAYPLAGIDVERTERENKTNLGNAVMIEGGKAVGLADAPPPPPKRPSLTDLIESKKAEIHMPATVTRRPAGPAAGTRAGTPDLASGNRAPFRNVEVSGDLKAFFFAKGVDGVEVLQGPSPRRPVLLVMTTSEAAVFKALVVSANALLVEREKHADLDGVDLVCVVPNGGRGGQFTLSPDTAAQLISGKVDITRFFVDNVQF